MSDNFLDEIARIVALEPHQLSPLEIGFLRARISYLTSDQIHKFESVLEVIHGATQSELKWGELKSKAKDLGLTVKVGTKKTELIKMIEDAEKADAELKKAE